LLQLLDFMQGGGFDFGVEIIFSSHVARESQLGSLSHTDGCSHLANVRYTPRLRSA
jgi:hypothetical protein